MNNEKEAIMRWEDRKGPLGKGPRTGRGLGRCPAGSNGKQSRVENETDVRGPGWGRGGGRPEGPSENRGGGPGRGRGRGRNSRIRGGGRP